MASKLYLFGIGGTGSRVIRALSMLLASGVKAGGFEIIPIIIDPDQANGDVTRTVEILKNYKSTHDSLSFTSKEKNKFFGTKISELTTGSNFKFDLGDIKNDQFKDFIGTSSLERANQALVNLLFSEDNLNADMEVGFKGNPNIGSVVLNRFDNSAEFKDLANNFKSGDRIFIISSIFGGTGAAGFPLLVKNFRNLDQTFANHQLIKNAPIGAITVLPYFNVNVDEQSSIDGATFVSKAKAALTYYYANISGNNSLNSLYYIADNYTNNFDNNEGGISQKNDAHFIELAAALSVIDFCEENDSELLCSNSQAINPNYKEFGVVNETKTIRLSNLSTNTQSLINVPLAQFTLFSIYLSLKIKQADKLVWYKNIDVQTLQTSNFYNKLNVFVKEYESWLKEMAENQRSFDPFNLNVGENIFDFINDVKPKKGLMGILRDHYSLYEYTLAKEEKSIGNQHSNNQKFMDLFYGTTKELVTSKFNF